MKNQIFTLNARSHIVSSLGYKHLTGAEEKRKLQLKLQPFLWLITSIVFYNHLVNEIWENLGKLTITKTMSLTIFSDEPKDIQVTMIQKQRKAANPHVFLSWNRKCQMLFIYGNTLLIKPYTGHAPNDGAPLWDLAAGILALQNCFRCRRTMAG